MLTVTVVVIVPLDLGLLAIVNVIAAGSTGAPSVATVINEDVTVAAFPRAFLGRARSNELCVVDLDFC